MDKGFLTEAFKELKMLNEEDYNLNNKDEIEDMHDTVFNQLDDKSIDIIDPNAQSVDDLEDSYVGKVILDCDVCHSKIYKDPSEVVIDDESSLANIDEECPYCYSTDGYKIIGEVASYDGASLEDNTKEDDADEDDEDKDDEDDTDEDDEELTEAKNKRCRKKSYLKESNSEGVTVSDLEGVISQLEEIIEEMQGRDIQTLHLAPNTYGLYGTFIGFPSAGYLSIDSPFGEDEEDYDYEDEDDEDSINEGILGKAVGGNLVGSTVGAGLGTALGSVAGVPGMIAGGIAGSALGGSAGSKLAAGSELLKDDIAPSKGQRKFKHLKSIDECNASNGSKSQLSNKIYKSKKVNEGLKHLKKSFKKNVSESQCLRCDRVADILQNSTYKKSGTYPRGFKFLSSNGTTGEVQYNGAKYAFRKRNDGTYKVMTSADAGSNWSETLYKESIEDINVNTTDGSVKVDQSEGNINISIEKNSLKDDKIIPVSSDVKDEIANNNEDDNNSEDDTVEFDDVDSQAFDELGESYLKKIYENVKSFKTTKSYQSGNKLVVEGKIKFTSNNVKPTQFIFENFNFNKSKEKIVMFGENAQISRGKKSFRLAGKLNENIFVPTSLRYAYSAKLDENKSQRITGHVKLNEAKAIDLSKVEGSMSNIIKSNMDKINNCKTKDELLSTIKKIFDENNLNTKASNRLLNNIAKCKNFVDALMVVTNSYLSGTGNKVIK